MPPGDVRCWILAAACDGADASVASATQEMNANAMRRVKIR
jgi:hypothetical protein